MCGPRSSPDAWLQASPHALSTWRSGALTPCRTSEHWWRDGPAQADSRASSLKVAREVARRRRSRPRQVTDRRARSAGRSDGFQACAAGQAERPSGRIMSEDAHARPAGDAPEPPGRLAGRRTGSPRSIGRCGCNLGKYGHPSAASSRCRSDGRIQLRCSHLPTSLESAFNCLRTGRIFAEMARAEWRFDYSLHLAPAISATARFRTRLRALSRRPFEPNIVLCSSVQGWVVTACSP